MARTETIRPIVHVGYMIEEVLIRKKEHNGWWVVWYNHKTKESAGMESFDSFDEASEWNENNKPRKIADGNFNRSTIIFAG